MEHKRGSVNDSDVSGLDGTEYEAGFGPGSIVVLSLVSPREKFWGTLLQISPSGISLRGLDLGSFEGVLSMIREGEQGAPLEVFFPMHRVERMEADDDTSGIPSVQQRFEKVTGHDARRFLKCAVRS
jgi:hypothetical protein